MPALQASVLVAANSSIENIITGSQFEYAPMNMQINVALVGSAAGLVCDVTTGSDVVAENFACSAFNRFPLIPDDFITQDVVRQGERIKVRVRNTTAGALTLFWAMQMVPAR